MEFNALAQAGTPVNVQLLDRAVQSFNSPTASPQTRAALNEILTKFTQRDDVPAFISSVLEAGCNPMTKFYAVIGLKHFVDHSWQTMPPDARTEFRGYVWGMMEKASMEHQETLRRGLCDALMGAAREEYPGMWPSFIQDLLHGSQGAPELVISCLEIIGSFSDAVSVFAKDSLTSARAAEIVNALNGEMQGVIQSIAAALGSGNEPVIDAALCALKSLVQWIEPQFFFETPILNELCSRFLGNPRFTESVVMIFGEVISANFIPEEYMERLPDLFLKIMESMKVLMDDETLATKPSIQTFLTLTMPTFMSLYGECVEVPEYAAPVGQLVEWILQMTDVVDEDHFGDAVEYWNGLMMRLVGEANDLESIVWKIYERFVPGVRRVLLRKIPSPIEMRENEEDDGARTRKVRTNLGFGDLFRTVKSALGFINRLEPQGTTAELREMASGIARGEGGLELINAFSWSLGALVSEMNEQTDRTFVADSLGLLIGISNKADSPEVKTAVTGNTCFLCGQANKFLLRDNQLFTNVVNWMFDLTSADNPDIQSISMECMKVLSVNNQDQMIKRIISPENPSILEQVLGSFGNIASRLPEEATVSFFEITSQMISNCPGDDMAEPKVAMFQVMSDFLGARLRDVLGSFTCENPQMCHQLVFIFNCFRAISGQLGNIFLQYFISIFDDLLNLYKNVTETIMRVTQMPAQPGARKPSVAFLHGVADGIIYLLDRAIYNSFNRELVQARLLPVCLGQIINDFKETPPAARCPKVLSLTGSLAVRYPSDFEQYLESVFVNLYHPALDMIKDNFTDYAAIRPEFYYFTACLVRSGVRMVLNLPAAELNTFIESIKWGAKHPQHEVSVSCTMLLGDFVESVSKILSGEEFASFVTQYGVALLLTGFQLLTDTSVKFAFHAHVRLIRILIQCPTMTNHASEIMGLMIEQFSAQEPNMLYGFMQSLFESVGNETIFTSRCCDFLVCVRHILRQDPDLKEAQKKQILEEADARFQDLSKPREGNN